MIEHVPTQEGYDRWSAIYDAEGNPLIALEEPVVASLLGGTAGLAIADIGCGTGRHALQLAAGGARVTAVDFSDGMLSKARDKAQRLGLANATFLQHNLLEPLPLPGAHFDRVICCLVFDHIPQPESLFSELRRICKTDGRVIVSVMHPAMMLKGLSARFADPVTGQEVRPESSPNVISDYVMGALSAGLTIDHISEHAPDAALAARCPRAEKYVGWPMLLAMRLLP